MPNLDIFTPRQQATLRALVDRIIPPDDFPGGWEAGVRTHHVDPFFWGEPSGVWADLRDWVTVGTSQGSLGEQIVTTLEEAVLGFVIGSILGIVLGIALGRVQLLSELFAPGQDTLLIYSYMYGPAMPSPCTSCTSILDGLDGTTPHVRQRVSFAVVARSPIERVRQIARERRWRNLRLLSSSRNSYNHDYHGETDDGWPLAAQQAMAAVLGVEVEVIPDAGHSPAIDQPAKTARMLVDFFHDYPNLRTV